jgi:hypothetical protein
VRLPGTALVVDFDSAATFGDGAHSGPLSQKSLESKDYNQRGSGQLRFKGCRQFKELIAFRLNLHTLQLILGTNVCNSLESCFSQQLNRKLRFATEPIFTSFQILNHRYNCTFVNLDSYRSLKQRYRNDQMSFISVYVNNPLNSG